MSKLKSLFIYGGIDKETYSNIRHRISDENKRSVNIFGTLAGLAFIFTGLSAIVGKQIVWLPIYFIGAGILFFVILLNILLHKKFPKISDVFAVLFSLILLTLGIFIAYTQSDDRTTMLLPLFTLVSLVFCYRPIYMVTILVVEEVAYLIVMKTVQTPDLFYVDMVNTLIFSIIGIIGGLYTLRMKHKRYAAEYQNIVLLEKDILTGLYNRYSWEAAIKKIEEDQKPVLLCSFDVNGLKKTNDSKGHLAGDELIIGAANCIQEVFGKYGVCYRIGGDEFSAIIYKEVSEDLLREAFQHKTSTWKGKKSDELSVAFAMVKLDHDYAENMQKVIHSVDLLMYKEKQKYHLLHGDNK